MRPTGPTRTEGFSQPLRRNRGIITGEVALGLAGVELSGSLITGGDRDTLPVSASPSPTETATDTAPGPVNGRITSALVSIPIDGSGTERRTPWTWALDWIDIDDVDWSSH